MFCQSCTMPIDNMGNRGTEKNGEKSSEYCKYCYEDGRFTEPDMTLEKMKTIVTTQMQKMNLPAELVQKSLNSLPYLKRWQAVHA